MFFIVLIFIAIVAGTIYSFANMGETAMGIVAGFLLAFAVCLLLIICVCVPLSTLAYDIGVPVVYEDTITPLVAMQDGTGTFVRSVHIKEDLNYFYLYPDEDGRGIASGQAKAKYSYINYTEKEPYLVFHQARKFDSFLWNLITFPETDEYYFYIPEGSIVQDYTIDLN